MKFNSMNPICLQQGLWDEGFSLDYHTVNSEYLGENEYGKPIFHTNRTELGELVYNLKYNSDRKALQNILNIISPFLNSWSVLNEVSYAIPVPPSIKSREFQPVEELTKCIAKYLNIEYGNVLEKSGGGEAKNMDRKSKKLSNTIKANKYLSSKRNILLVDDIYQSGETLKECVKILRNDNNIHKIYVLTMTKTRSK